MIYLLMNVYHNVCTMQFKKQFFLINFKNRYSESLLLVDYLFII